MIKRNTFTLLLSNRTGCHGLESWVKLLTAFVFLCPFVIPISCERQKAGPENGSASFVIRFQKEKPTRMFADGTVASLNQKQNNKRHAPILKKEDQKIVNPSTPRPEPSTVLWTRCRRLPSVKVEIE